MKSFKWDEFIDDSVIINLKDRTDRRELLDDRMNRIKIDKEKTLKDYSRYFDAIDATMLNEIPNDIVKREYPFDFQFEVDSNDTFKHLYNKGRVIKSNDSEVACAYSHYLVWKNIVDNEIPVSLIMEDDVLFHYDFLEKLGELFTHHLPSDYDLLFLSYNPTNSYKVEKFNNLLNKVHMGLWTLTSCILTYEGAKKLLSNTPIMASPDVWVNQQFKNLNVYAFDNPIMNQSYETPSSNLWSYSNYCYQNSQSTNILAEDLEEEKLEAIMYYNTHISADDKNKLV